MLNENYVPLDPVNYFQLSADCHFLGPKDEVSSKKYRLPDTAALCGGKAFAEIGMGWNEGGITFDLVVKYPFYESHYPDIDFGDSLEVFIDTRDVKTAGFNTRFCHHFFFLPKEVEGHQAGEITHFRTEDIHELCDPRELKVQSHFKTKEYGMRIFIPKQCLHGYDPKQFDRIGFTYRVNRPGRKHQHFSVTTEDYQIGQQPSLWSSLRLVK